MSEFGAVEKRDLDDLTYWAFGDKGGNGARALVKKMDSTLYDKDEGLEHLVKKMSKQNERRSYLIMGGLAGVLVMLVFLGWQGNQQAQNYLQLIQELREVLP